jgi:hypothetical protein
MDLAKSAHHSMIKFLSKAFLVLCPMFARRHCLLAAKYISAATS